MKPTLNYLPDLAQSFARVKTLLELEEKVNTNTILGYAIKKAFIDKEPPAKILQMIKDQIRDERKAVITCIPEYIVRSIEKNFPEIQSDPNDIPAQLFRK